MLLVFLSCKKIKKGNCHLDMVESTSQTYPTYYSQITKSTLKHITFSGNDINGTLNKSGSNVDGILTIGNDFPYKYTFTITISGSISSKTSVEGNYSSDVRSGTFKIKL